MLISLALIVVSCHPFVGVISQDLYSEALTLQTTKKARISEFALLCRVDLNISSESVCICENECLTLLMEIEEVA